MGIQQGEVAAPTHNPPTLAVTVPITAALSRMNSSDGKTRMSGMFLSFCMTGFVRTRTTSIASRSALIQKSAHRKVCSLRADWKKSQRA